MEGKLNKRKDLKRLYIDGTITREQYNKELGDLELMEKPVTDNLGQKKAWMYHKQIKNKWEMEGRPGIEDLKVMASGLKKEKYKVLFFLLYLTAARISEIVQVFTRRHTEETLIDGRPFLIIRLENRKNRKRKFKEIAIPMDYPKHEKEFAEIIINYIKNKDKDEIIFKMSKVSATYYLKKYAGINAHLLRVLRCTHLATMYGIDSPTLIKYAGWSDARPAVTYINLNRSDIANIFPKEDLSETSPDSR